jgi:hypothetical protein
MCTMANVQQTLSLRGRLLVGTGMVLFGLVPMLATIDVGPLGTEDINGPAWLGLASGGAIAAGGLAFIAGQERPLASGFLALLALIGLAAIGNWIAFGVGARACSGSIPFWTDNAFSGLGCRIPFGIGALMTNAFVLVGCVALLQKSLGGPPRLARLRRIAEGAVVLSFAPILLPMFLVLIVVSLVGATRTWLRTGKWPRNESFIARQRAKRNKNP